MFTHLDRHQPCVRISKLAPHEHLVNLSIGPLGESLAANPTDNDDIGNLRLFLVSTTPFTPNHVEDVARRIVFGNEQLVVEVLVEEGLDRFEAAKVDYPTVLIYLVVGALEDEGE
jgi:hypothetical protein